MDLPHRPQGDEPGAETWHDESWRYSGNTNVWSWMSCDDETGWVYFGTGTPTSDYYGGHRHGDNLYAESLVAIDTATGEKKWHFQAVRHGLWDYDFPCAPILLDIEVDGELIEAVAQVSKQAFTYVFDRKTGEPVWPIEERKVPESLVPGEWTASMQPFPTKPPPFDRQGVRESDLIDFTPELNAKALEIYRKTLLGGPMFTPPTLAGEGRRVMAQLPGQAGGANWAAPPSIRTAVSCSSRRRRAWARWRSSRRRRASPPTATTCRRSRFPPARKVCRSSSLPGAG